MKRLTLIAAILLVESAFAMRLPLGKSHNLPVVIEIKNSSYQNAVDAKNKIHLVKFKIIQKDEFEDILDVAIVYVPDSKKGDMLRIPILTTQAIDEKSKMTIRQGEFLISREMITGSKARLTISTIKNAGTDPYEFLLDEFLE
jgi:hypothetical protein